MSIAVLKQIRHALSNLNPEEVRGEARRPVRIRLMAPAPETYGRMETFLCPMRLAPARRAEVSRMILRGSGSGPAEIEFWDESLLRPADAFAFPAERPEQIVGPVLNRHRGLWLALARNFEPFRQPVLRRLIHTVSKENALFSMATAVGDIVPSIASLPWAVAEFTSDTAFLTMNQIRLAFLVAAASGREPGYREQRAEIGSIVAGAFGWRAAARELAGKIPFGGGLIPKAAIAYAGTYVVGVSLERFYRIGSSYTAEERKAAYEAAYERGKQIVKNLLPGRPTAAAG